MEKHSDFVRPLDLQELLVRPGPCISIYLPTERIGRRSKENALRMRAALREAEQLLAQATVPERPGLLAAVQKLSEDIEYWSYQSESAGIFAAPGFFRCFRFATPLHRMVQVGSRFHIKPLLTALQDAVRFSVLCVSGNEVRLIGCSERETERIALSGLPSRVEEEQPRRERELQYHTQSGTMHQGRRSAVYFGHASGADRSQKKARYKEFFETVRPVLDGYLRRAAGPLMLAAADWIHPLFHGAVRGSRVLQEGLIGNAEDWSDDEVCDRACPIVRSELSRRRDSEYSRAIDLSGGSSHISSDFRHILRMAFMGVVEEVYVPSPQCLWGKYDGRNDRLEVHAKRQPGDEDLLDRIAHEVLSHGGRVRVLSESAGIYGPAALLRAAISEGELEASYP